MTAVTLGFKAFDAHELLCHFVAVKTGLYKKSKLQVELVDLTFIPETELPWDWFQVSCGAALASAVKGIPQRVIFVATDRPMFWIYASRNIKSLGELKNKRVATFPVVTPPHHLANIIMTRAGLDVSVEVSLRSTRDDVARIGLLKGGYVDAAVISSAIAPARLTALGFNSLCFFGDEVRVPTTGLGIAQASLDQDFELSRTLRDAHRESLSLIHNDSKLVGHVLQEYFGIAGEHAEATARLYQACYTHDGKTTADIAQVAIDALSKSLNVSAHIPWQEIYQF